MTGDDVLQTTGQVASGLLSPGQAAGDTAMESSVITDGNELTPCAGEDPNASLRDPVVNIGSACYEKFKEQWKVAKRDSSAPKGTAYEIPDNTNFSPVNLKDTRSIAAAAATLSYYRKRPTNAAVILLLGTSGSGKSSTVNTLFDAKVCNTNDLTSCTSALDELTITRHCNDLQMKNAKIVIVDTPGFKDSKRGRKFDNQVLLKIKDYFRRKEHIPTLILLTVKLWDNRIGGEFSDFAIYLRIIRAVLADSVIDIRNPNLIIVATHCCQDNAGKESISRRLQIVQKIVQQNLGLPFCPVVAAENNIKSTNLTKVEDFWKLPTGDIYPLNLYKTLIVMTQSNDLVGYGIINEAFPKLRAKGLRPVRTSISIIETFDDEEDEEQYNRTLKELEEIASSAENDNVSMKLAKRMDEQWLRLSDKERRLCQLSPNDEYNEKDVVQQLVAILGVRNYRQIIQLPKLSSDKMAFFLRVSHSKQISDFYKQAFELNLPKLPQGLPLGRFYDPLTDAVTTDFAFTLESPSEYLNDMGLVVPSHVVASYKPFSARIFVQGNIRQLTTYRMYLLHLIPTDLFQGSFPITNGFNIKVSGDVSPDENHSEFSVAFLHSAVRLSLSPRLACNEQVKLDLLNLKRLFNRNGSIPIETLKVTIRKHGAYYVKKVDLGGQIVFTFKTTPVTMQNLPLNDLEWTRFFFSHSPDMCFIRVTGGDKGLAKTLEQSCSTEEYWKNHKLWRDSLYEDLQVLEMTTKVNGIWSLLDLKADVPFLLKMESAVSKCTALKLAPSTKTIFSRKKLRDLNRARTLSEVQSATFFSVKFFGSIGIGSLATAIGIEGLGLAAGTGAVAAVADAAIVGLVLTSGFAIVITTGALAVGAGYGSYYLVRKVFSD